MNPQASFTDMTKLLAEAWKTISEEEKAVFQVRCSPMFPRCALTVEGGVPAEILTNVPSWFPVRGTS
jgi:hypothetical protein